MKILPPTTRPPSGPVDRQHDPKPATAWSRYRSCLRWDFGFTCALCLLHEIDLFGAHGGDGLAGTTAEHIEPRSDRPDRSGDYKNLLYACRLCNTARSNLPVKGAGYRLLNPTQDAWGRHFKTDHDRLEPISGDQDASYTERVYDLNDPRKIRRREFRRRLIEDRLHLLANISKEITYLLNLAERSLQSGDIAKFVLITRQTGALRQSAIRALQDLARFPAVPMDKPETCRCQPAEPLVLPSWLDNQLLDLDVA